jgi:hypothetical protein
MGSSTGEEGPPGAAGASTLYHPGTHVCLIYDGETERRDVVARFIEEGIISGERVAYFTDAEPDDVRGWLSERGIDLPAAPQFTAHRSRDVYCPDGSFDPERMYSYWHVFHDDSRDGGFACARATGETTWSRDVRDGDRIVEYEARLNDVLATMPVTALCQYDVRKFDGATILDVLRIHPVMLVGGQLVRNPYYVTPEQFFAARVSRDSRPA